RALDSSGARFYGARHENCAIAMADGYVYAAGRLGVAVIGRGPALANGLHGAIYASRTGSPVLLIYGEAATISQPNGFGPDYKAIDGPGVLRAARIAHLLGHQSTSGARSARRRRSGCDDRHCGELALADKCAARHHRTAREAAADSAGRTKRSSGQTAIHRGGRGAPVEGHPPTHR